MIVFYYALTGNMLGTVILLGMAIPFVWAVTAWIVELSKGATPES